MAPKQPNMMMLPGKCLIVPAVRIDFLKQDTAALW